MTKESLAAQLDGREYGNEISPKEVQAAKDAGLIVIFGYSDDNIELRGAINDEIGAWDGIEFCITGDEILTEGAVDEISRDYPRIGRIARREFERGIRVSAEWCPKDEPELAWRITASSPSASFMIYDGGEQFCRGIVIEAPEEDR